jgi:hypothetical protein
LLGVLAEKRIPCFVFVFFVCSCLHMHARFLVYLGIHLASAVDHLDFNLICGYTILVIKVNKCRSESDPRHGVSLDRSTHHRSRAFDRDLGYTSHVFTIYHLPYPPTRYPSPALQR